jgi:hypothetical protein
MSSPHPPEPQDTPEQAAATREPSWLRSVRGTLNEPAWPAAPDAVVAAAKAAFTWRTIDEELAALAYDSRLDEAALVRNGRGADAVLVFDGPDAQVTVLVADGEVRGQLTPAEPGAVTVLGPDGTVATAEIDGQGSFAFPQAGSAPLRLRIATAGRSFLTSWFRAVAR